MTPTDTTAAQAAPTETAVKKTRKTLYPVSSLLNVGDSFDAPVAPDATPKQLALKRAAIYVAACRKGIPIKTFVILRKDANDQPYPVAIKVQRSESKPNKQPADTQEQATPVEQGPLHIVRDEEGNAELATA